EDIAKEFSQIYTSNNANEEEKRKRNAI
uniref:Uncharacterized protein n=1 Tax=Acrobeloides nanus TaxID=290746 RepID=A0A914CVC5_9BILA